jgi:hypothetical protein
MVKGSNVDVQAGAAVSNTLMVCDVVVVRSAQSEAVQERTTT